MQQVKGAIMRKIKDDKHFIISIIFVVIFVLFLLSGCSSTGSRNFEKYGTDITTKEVTNIRDILINPKEYLDHTIRLEGKITRQCPSGCWFFLEDNTGTIYVDINPSGLSIPPKVGRNVTVEGIPSNRSGRIVIIGKGVAF
jgi:uncharacterized protein YdeI (BOF family)